jgi:hypothetical protein
MRSLAISAIVASAALCAMPAAAQTPGRSPASRSAVLAPPPPGLQCRQAIQVAERAAAVPQQLMAAIARVESGRPDSRGTVHPWPWTINAEGAGQFFDSKEAAIAAVRTLQARGVRSIDVGCMQVNLMHHPDAFSSLDQAFDPAANAQYAARFLSDLYGQTRDWTRATAFYHSNTPDLGDAYQRRVAAVWPEEQKRAGSTPLLSQHVFSQNAFTANMWNTGPAARPRGQAALPRTRL